MSLVRHPGVNPQCPSCHGADLVVRRDGERARAELCQCVRLPCPRCKGLGMVTAGEAWRAPVQRCTCQRVMARIHAFNESGIPARHADSTLLTFRDTTSSSLTMVKAKVSRYLADYEPGGGDNRGLILYGQVGTGKTHLLAAMVRSLILRRGTRSRFVEFSHLLADLKTGFDHGRGAAALLDPLVHVPVLAIDELGKGRNTEFEAMVVDELVSRRYNAALPILASTNFSPGPATGSMTGNQASADSRPALADRLGDRVYSRLREMCDFVPVKGQDYRETKRRLRRA